MMQKQAEPKSLQLEEVTTRIRLTMCWHFQVFSVELSMYVPKISMMR